MFARCLTLQLKPNAADQVASVLEKEIVPALRKQKGFRDTISLISADGSQGLALSFWDTREDAEAYNRTGYPDVLKAMSKVVEGTPEVKTFEVAHSTLPKITARGA